MSRLFSILRGVLLLFIYIFLFAESPGQAKQVVLNPRKSITSQLVYENTVYLVRSSINLRGMSIRIPDDCTLKFERLGRIRNGSIIGNKTIIESSKNGVFKDVDLLGTFQGTESRPEWFVDSDYERSILKCIDRFQGVLLDNKYLINSSVIIEKPIVISGGGELVFKNNVDNCIEIHSSNVKINGIKIMVPDISSTIIHVTGNAQKPLSHISISKCVLFGGLFSIVLDYCDSSYVTDCIIRDVERTAVGLYSSHFIYVCNNEIRNVNIHHRHQNSYGITATFHYGDPKSTDVVISNNFVSNNPYWEALDTHGGERIVFSNNIITNCWRGIAAVGDMHRDIMLCKDIIIEGNNITCSNEPLSNGIVFTGVGDDLLSENIELLRNKVYNSVIALYSTNNENVVIRENSLFATDEIWRDVGSRNVLFERNNVELSEGNATFYEKTVFYFKPTVSLTNRVFGQINDNSIVTRGASVMTYYKPLSSFKSSLSENRNQIR